MDSWRSPRRLWWSLEWARSSRSLFSSKRANVSVRPLTSMETRPDELSPSRQRSGTHTCYSGRPQPSDTPVSCMVDPSTCQELPGSPMDFSPPTGQRFSRPDSETDRRRAGMMGLIFDLLIAEAADHALGKYNSVGDGIIMISTLMLELPHQ